MKLYVVPSMAYKASNFGATANILASIIVAENRQEAIGTALINLKEEFPVDEGWIYSVGDIADDDTEKIKQLVKML